MMDERKAATITVNLGIVETKSMKLDKILVRLTKSNVTKDSFFLSSVFSRLNTINGFELEKGYRSSLIGSSSLITSEILA